MEENEDVYDNFKNTSTSLDELNKILKDIYIKSLMNVYKEFIQNINSWKQDRLYSTLMRVDEMSNNSHDNFDEMIEDNKTEFESIINHFSSQ